MSYTGLCIDGPFAGQMLASERGAHRVPELEPLSGPCDAEVAGDDVTFTVHTYVHAFVRISEGQYFRFWRLEQDSVEAALAKLCAGYTHNCARLKEGVDVSSDTVEFATYCFVHKHIGGEDFLKGVPASGREDLIKHRMGHFRGLVRTALEAVWPI